MMWRPGLLAFPRAPAAMEWAPDVHISEMDLPGVYRYNWGNAMFDLIRNAIET
ncbi:hypothetical protein GCM10020370_47780 [Paenibacillus hodogayensis]